MYTVVSTYIGQGIFTPNITCHACNMYIRHVSIVHEYVILRSASKIHGVSILDEGCTWCTYQSCRVYVLCPGSMNLITKASHHYFIWNCSQGCYCT